MDGGQVTIDERKKVIDWRWMRSERETERDGRGRRREEGEEGMRGLLCPGRGQQLQGKSRKEHWYMVIPSKRGTMWGESLLIEWRDWQNKYVERFQPPRTLLNEKKKRCMESIICQGEPNFVLVAKGAIPAMEVGINVWIPTGRLQPWSI